MAYVKVNITTQNIKEINKMTNNDKFNLWAKTYDIETEDHVYRCTCGALMDDDCDYNGDTGHYECPLCGSESPDLDMISDME